MKEPIINTFMRQTAIKNLPPSPEKQGVPQPPLQVGYPPDALLFDLPKPETLSIPEISLRAAMDQRKSRRDYADKPLSLPELTWLLWYTQGVRKVTSRPITLRSVPSAGGRHGFETYLLANRVENLVPGLYRYAALEHALLPVDLEPGLDEKLVLACDHQETVKNCGVAFFWVAVPERLAWRYSDRGYRYLLLDCGHICQSMYLAAEAIDCGVCAIGAFEDDLLNAALGVDGEKMFATYGAVVGKKAPAINGR